MQTPDIKPVKPKIPLDPEENKQPAREARRRSGRQSLVSAGRLMRKAAGVKASLLG